MMKMAMYITDWNNNTFNWGSRQKYFNSLTKIALTCLDNTLSHRLALAVLAGAIDRTFNEALATGRAAACRARCLRTRAEPPVSDALKLRSSTSCHRYRKKT